MNKDQWQQIEKIFYAAMELPREERDDFISQACAGDEELQSKVQALLAANQDAESFLDSPVNMPPQSGTFSPTLVMPHPTANAGEAVESGVRIGAYRLIREIGRGGMGAVWLAERADGQFYQQVAIKLLHAGSENEEVIRRFRHERQILASLDHPNIARLLDGGTTEDGRPYFVMEHIEGLPIDEYCRQHQLSVDDRLKLFRQVCAAVHYAHQNLVIHRDLKPSNIAVTADGTPKLLDFGIAKLIQPDLSRSYDTLTGVTPMTPAYASPEQVRGEKLTTASDVYSLGVVLYELLTGRSPYRLKAHGFGELMRAVIEQEPERPSTAITRADGAPPTNPITIEPTEKLRRRLSGDIDSIVLMALRKEPPSRYGSVEQFSEDLRRYLEGLPTVARRGTFGYRALKYIRRNKVPIAAAAVVLLSLLGGIGASLYQARTARNAQARAENQELSNRRLLYASQMKQAQNAWENSNVDRVRELLMAHLPKPGEEDLRGFEWYYLWQVTHSELTTLQHSAEVSDIAFTPDGRSLITIEGAKNFEAKSSRTLRIWHTFSGQGENKVIAQSREIIGKSIAIPKNGQFFVTGGDTLGFSLWDTATGKLLRRIGEANVFLCMALSADGTRLAGGFIDGSGVIYDVQTGQELSRWKGFNRYLQSIVFSPDGKKVAGVGGNPLSLKMWDAGSCKELWLLQHENMDSTGFLPPVFSPDGNYIIYALGSDSGFIVMNSLTGKETKRIKFQGLVQSRAYSPDGKILASAEHKPGISQVVLWDTANWQILTTIKGQSFGISALAFSTDGQKLATASRDTTVKLWDIKQNLEADSYPIKNGKVLEMAFSPDAKRLFILDSEALVTAFDTHTKQALYTVGGQSKQYFTVWGNPRFHHLLAQTSDGSRIATSGDQNIKIRDATTGKELLNINTPHLVNYALSFSPDGRRIVVNSCLCPPDKEVDYNYLGIWDATTGLQLQKINLPGLSTLRAVFLQDNQTLVTSGITGHLVWWDVETGKPIKTADTGLTQIVNHTLSPNGKMLAVADDIASIFLFDSMTGVKLSSLKGHTSSVMHMVFSPDSKRLLTRGGDRTARLWDLLTGQELMIFQELRGGSVAFSPDGKKVAISSQDGIVKELTTADPKSVMTTAR